MKYLLLSCFWIVLLQGCEESVKTAKTAQAESGEEITPLELVINGFGGHLLTLPISRAKFLAKAQNPSELRDYLLHLCGNSQNPDCILTEATKRKSIFLFEDNTTNPPLEIGAQLVVNLVKTAKFIVCEKQRGRLSLEIDGLVIVFCTKTIVPRSLDRRGPLTKTLFESSFTNGQYKVESIKWLGGVIELFYPLIDSLKEVPLTMEFIAFLQENIDYFMGKRSQLSSKFLPFITTAFALLFFKHLGIPAPDDSHSLEPDSNNIIRVLNTIRLPGDSEIAPDSGVPGIVAWVGDN